MTLNWVDCPKCKGTGKTTEKVPVNSGTFNEPHWGSNHVVCSYVSGEAPLGGGKFKKPPQPKKAKKK